MKHDVTHAITRDNLMTKIRDTDIQYSKVNSLYNYLLYATKLNNTLWHMHFFGGSKYMKQIKFLNDFYQNWINFCFNFTHFLMNRLINL